MSLRAVNFSINIGLCRDLLLYDSREQRSDDAKSGHILHDKGGKTEKCVVSSRRVT